MKTLKKIFTKRNLILIFSAITFYSAVACGSAEVYVKPNTHFNRQMSVTINGTNDQSGMNGELQYALSSNGFNVVSESVAKNSINLYHNGQLNPNDFNINSQLYKSIELKSVYVLNPTYNWTFNGFTYRILNFHAEVVDLFTGEVVMNINFRGDRTPNGVAKRIVEELNKQIK